MPTIWFWPNPDAGTGEMAESLRHFREQHGRATEKMRFITNVPVDEFVALLKRAACLIGNSSAGIKECSFLGTPVVNIGGRQQGRLRAEQRRARRLRPRRDSRRRRARSSRHGRYAAVAHLLPARTRARRSSTCWPASSSTPRSVSTTPRTTGVRTCMTDRHAHHDRAARDRRGPALLHHRGGRHQPQRRRRRWPPSSSRRPPRPAPTRSSSRRTFPSTRCCAAARRPRTSASRCSIC